MNLFTRMIRSLQESALLDRGFETYYGALVRSQEAGGPTASEARRDFMAARRPVDRIGII
jgi:hypothetical protein